MLHLYYIFILAVNFTYLNYLFYLLIHSSFIHLYIYLNVCICSFIHSFICFFLYLTGIFKKWIIIFHHKENIDVMINDTKKIIYMKIRKSYVQPRATMLLICSPACVVQAFIDNAIGPLHCARSRSSPSSWFCEMTELRARAIILYTKCMNACGHNA